jgi:release factor glutamine methyltransferase
MTINQAITHFTSELSALYPPDECKSMGRLYFSHRLGFSRSDILLRGDEQLLHGESKFLEQALSRLKLGEPIQYVLGCTWFMDFLFEVGPGVLIPRPETEELVQWIAVDLGNSPSRVLDIGTGSGCIAVSLAKLLANASVSAWDISPDALAIAEMNANENQCSVSFSQTDVLAYYPTPNSPMFDVIVSNPPYVTNTEKQAMHTNVLDYEPHLALFVEDDDPLLFYRKIAMLGCEMLKKGGCLYFEINEQFGDETVRMLDGLGYANVECRADIHGKDRMVKAVWR